MALEEISGEQNLNQTVLSPGQTITHRTSNEQWILPASDRYVFNRLRALFENNYIPDLTDLRLKYAQKLLKQAEPKIKYQISKDYLTKAKIDFCLFIKAGQEIKDPVSQAILESYGLIRRDSVDLKKVRMSDQAITRHAHRFLHLRALSSHQSDYSKLVMDEESLIDNAIKLLNPAPGETQEAFRFRMQNLGVMFTVDFVFGESS